MRSLTPNLKRPSPTALDDEELFASPGNDELILPPVSTFMTSYHHHHHHHAQGRHRSMTTSLTPTTSDTDVPMLPSLQELHLLPEKVPSGRVSPMAGHTGFTGLSFLPPPPPTATSSASTTPRQRKQYRRRNSNSGSNNNDTAQQQQQQTTYNFFDKSIEASLEGFNRTQNSFDSAHKTSLDLLLLGEAAADLEKEEKSNYTNYNNNNSNATLSRKQRRYSTDATPSFDQDVLIPSGPSSLTPSAANTPPPQLPMSMLPSLSQSIPSSAVAAAAAPYITSERPQLPLTTVSTTTVGPMRGASADAGYSTKVRVFENGVDLSGGVKTPPMTGPNKFIIGQEPRARRRSSAINKDSLYCHFCGRRNTPEWRKGPDGPATLCNACGLQWAKRQKMLNNKGGAATTAKKNVTTATVPPMATHTAPSGNIFGMIPTAATQPGQVPFKPIDSFRQMPQTPLEETTSLQQTRNSQFIGNTAGFIHMPTTTTTTAAAAAERIPLFQSSIESNVVLPPPLPESPVPASPEASLKSKLAVLSALSASAGITMHSAQQPQFHNHHVHHIHHRSGVVDYMAQQQQQQQQQQLPPQQQQQQQQQQEFVSQQNFAATLSSLASLANSIPRSSSLSGELQAIGTLNNNNNVVLANKISNGSSPLK